MSICDRLIEGLSEYFILESKISDDLVSDDGNRVLSARQGLLLKRIFDSLPNPIFFEGSLGEGGTISELYSPSDEYKGAAYYVVSSGVYDEQEADVKDFFVCNGSEWILIKNTDSRMDNFYTKSEVQSIISETITGIVSFDYQIVDTLPRIGVKGTIFLVPASNETHNIYDEYLYVADDWEKIGSTDIDLSNYYSKSEMDSFLNSKADSSDVYDKNIIDELLNQKQDNLSSGVRVNIENNQINVKMDKFTRVVNQTNFEVWVNTQYVQVLLKGSHAVTTSWTSFSSTALNSDYRPKTNILQPIGITSSRQNYFQVTSEGLVQVIGTTASSNDSMRGAVMYPRQSMY